MEPTNIYGLWGLIVTVLGGGLATYYKFKLEQEKTRSLQLAAEKENIQKAITEVYAEWKSIVAVVKEERNGIRQDYQQQSVQLMDAHLRIQELEKTLTSANEKIFELETRIAAMEKS